jgi:hypothetical protein
LRGTVEAKRGPEISATHQSMLGLHTFYKVFTISLQAAKLSSHLIQNKRRINQSQTCLPPTPKRGRFQTKKREICESTAIALNIHIDTIEVHHTTMYNCVDVYLFHEKIHR